MGRSKNDHIQVKRMNDKKQGSIIIPTHPKEDMNMTRTDQKEQIMEEEKNRNSDRVGWYSACLGICKSGRLKSTAPPITPKMKPQTPMTRFKQKHMVEVDVDKRSDSLLVSRMDSDTPHTLPANAGWSQNVPTASSNWSRDLAVVCSVP